MAKCALVCGAGGFVGGHLVKRLKRDGLWVRGVALRFREFSETEFDDFVVGNLRDRGVCRAIVDRRFDAGKWIGEKHIPGPQGWAGATQITDLSERSCIGSPPSPCVPDWN